MTPLNLVFGGTPEFAVPALEALIAAGHSISAVYTQPDRPAGRGQKSHVSAVKACALRNNLHLEQPTTLRDPAAASHLTRFRADAFVVVAYGLILPQAILDVPKLGCINIHGSLLPRWRGAAPIQRALLAGDIETGVSIMVMDAGLDTGPVLTMRSTAIADNENSASLHDRLAGLGANALCETLTAYAASECRPTPQSQVGASYAQKIRKEEAVIDWSQTTTHIDRQVRAFNPRPIAETRLRDQQLKIWEASIADTRSNQPSGTVLDATDAGIAVATGDGALLIKRLQLAGRKSMTAADFIRSQRIVGERLGAA